MKNYITLEKYHNHLQNSEWYSIQCKKCCWCTPIQ